VRIDFGLWKDDPALLQEWVPGIGAGVNMLVKDGRILAISGHQRLREVPITGGTGSAHVSLTNEAIFDAAKRLLKETPFKNGVIMFELRVDPETGRFWFVEINPRYWASITNALVSGVNFPKLHVESFVTADVPVEPAGPSRIVESRFVMGEIRVAFELLVARRWRDFGGLFKRHSAEPLMFEDFGLGGLRTFLIEVRHAIRSMKSTGNFGFQTAAKDRFFVDAYAERMTSCTTTEVLP
jgi:hypothetical protein